MKPKFVPSIELSIFIWGLLWRLKPLLTSNLWLDEVLSILIAKNTSLWNLLRQGEGYWDYVHPSFYYVFLKPWVNVFTYNEHLLRGLSLAWYPITFWALSQILTPLVSKKTKLVTLFLFSIHQLFVSMSYQVRMYPFALGLATLSLHFLFRYVSIPRRHYLVLSCICLAGSFYFDYAGFWLLGTLGFFWLSRSMHSNVNSLVSRRLSHVILGTTILCLPQLLVLGTNILFDRINPGSVPAEKFFEEHYFFEILRIFGLYHLELRYFSLIIVGSILALWLTYRETKWQLQLLNTLFWLPIVISTLFSVAVIPVFLARNLLLSSLALSIILAKVVTQSSLNLKHSVVIIFALYALIATSFSILETDFLYTKGLDRLSQIIAQSQGKAVFLPHTQTTAATEYYFTKHNLNQNQIVYVSSVDQLPAILDSLDQTYYIFLSNNCNWLPDCYVIRDRLLSQECLSYRCQTFFQL